MSIVPYKLPKPIVCGVAFVIAIAQCEQILNIRALAHLVLALISFDVCRYLPSLGVSSTIENNRKPNASQTQKLGVQGPLDITVF